MNFCDNVITAANVVASQKILRTACGKMMSPNDRFGSSGTKTFSAAGGSNNVLQGDGNIYNAGNDDSINLYDVTLRRLQKKSAST